MRDACQALGVTRPKGGALRSFMIAVLLCLITSVYGNAQVTFNVLYRVFKVRIGTMVCSAFTIEIRDQQFLVTARHCLGTPPAPSQADLWLNNKWERVTTKWYFPDNSDVDIAAATIGKEVGRRFEFPPTMDGIQIGGPVYFLGYPSGLGSVWRLPLPSGFGELPFIKAGILSAIDARNPDAILLYVDGHNNPGFSGGPIVFRKSTGEPFRVAGVVGGYRPEPVPVLKAKDFDNRDAVAHDDLYARVNSGIVVGYNIKHIVGVLEKVTSAAATP